MPLPSGGIWPPRNLEPIYQQYAVHNAWYTGNPDELALTYGDAAGSRPANRPSTYRGGIVGAAARWFWGAPIPAGEKRTKLHVPIASDICSTAADLLYSEPPSITVEGAEGGGGGDTVTQDRLNELIEQGLHSTLLELAEVGAALGGAFLRVVWDPAVAKMPWLGVVHADAAVPEWRWGRLQSVTFWRVVEQDDTTFLRHLERHEPGHILHSLYAGEAGDLGKPINLSASPATAGLKPAVPTNVDKLTAVYVPNMRPQRQWRNFPAGANLGRSDLAGVEPFLDALDEVYTSWMRDIRLGKGRIHIPSSYLQSNGPGKGAYADLDREAYEALDTLGSSDGKMELTVSQFAIRVAEHQQTAQDLVAQILRTAGYSQQTFGLANDGTAMTATEIVARERRSFVTRDRKIVYARPELVDAIETLLAVDAANFGSGVTPARPDIVFGDSVSADMQSLAATAELLRRAEAASDETLVRLVHPDWDKDQVDEEVQKIGDARPDPMADPFALPGDMVGPDGQPVDPAKQDPAAKDGPPGQRQPFPNRK